MKYTTIAFGLLLSFSSFATTVNGFEVKNLPTASRSYQDIIYNESEIEASSAVLKSRCIKGKTDAEAFARNNGFKILSSVGCGSVKVENRMGGMSYDGIHLSTDFEVLFK